jgi:site-specific DNA recombinase
MTTAAIYARVSSARQKEQQTIASQTAALRAHAAASGLEVPSDWVFEDEGYSGATLMRPALERLRDLATEIEIPVVLCHAPDRLARRYVYQTLLIDEFARVGTEVRFLKARKAETPEGELLLQFQGMIAEYERAQIAERTRRGKIHRARSGSAAVLCGAPYGYRYVRRTDETDARYEIVEPQAAVVREMFRRYVEEQESIAGLARWLAAQGVSTTTGKPRWDRSTLWGMLRNPAYCGRAAFGKTRATDECPKITRPGCRRSSRTRCSNSPLVVSKTISVSRPGGPRSRRSCKDSWLVAAVVTATTGRPRGRASNGCTTTAAWAPTTTATNGVGSATILPCGRTTWMPWSGTV